MSSLASPSPPTEVPGDWLRPQWRGRQPAGVGSLMSTRAGGVSGPPWAGLNLGMAVGDSPAAVQLNRRRFQAALGGASPIYLKQVHGTRVLRLTPRHAEPDSVVEEADACLSTEPGLACVVQVADCLPVLFAAPDGRGVAAAHAGWRGLAEGVLEASLSALCEASGCAPAEVQIWLGACIGPRHFEVGPEVRERFMATQGQGAEAHFKPGAAEGKWLADLVGLARDRLRTAGAGEPAGGEWCTFESALRFFSFRRDGSTGRMAAAIWIEP